MVRYLGFVLRNEFTEKSGSNHSKYWAITLFPAAALHITWSENDMTGGVLANPFRNMSLITKSNGRNK